VEPKNKRFDQAVTADTVSVGTEHVTSWVSRSEAVAIVNLMGDGATPQIARPHVWHRPHNSVVLDDTGKEDPGAGRARRVRADRRAGRHMAADGPLRGPSPAAAEAGDFVDFLTLPAYERMP
jgi:malate synthase